ncbi:hypothetical protein GF357_05290 [Candidatus Dojkabacteria bacterium]|nr:hypothetical protein [Candidatus Dojkabacteria bacterium]
MLKEALYTIFNLGITAPVRLLGQTNIGDTIEKRIDNLEEEDFSSPPFSKDGEIKQLVTLIQQIAIPAGVTVLMVLFAYGGFMMITSQGDPEKLNEAKEILTNAVMGFIFIALASTILVIINNTLSLGAEQFF